jgi:DNA (cytosine-5)-methyltransferase 1
MFAGRRAKKSRGLPSGFDIPSFTRSALVRAIGNGVPYGIARALAEAVKSRVPADVTLCACACGRPAKKKCEKCK